MLHSNNQLGLESFSVLYRKPSNSERPHPQEVHTDRETVRSKTKKNEEQTIEKCLERLERNSTQMNIRSLFNVLVLVALSTAATMKKAGRLTYTPVWNEGTPIPEAFPNTIERTTLVTRGNKKISQKYHLIVIDGSEKLEILVGPFVDQLQDYFEATGINGLRR
ncbi:hypothetical protein THAOC_21954, partial [Thalassiosira oceanica]